MSNGWKLVPVEPTEEMLEAGRNTPLAGEDDVDAPEDYRAVFVSMVEAAPQPPSVGGDVEVRRVSVQMLKGGSWRYKAEPDGAMVMFEDHRAHVTARDQQIASVGKTLADVRSLVNGWRCGHSSSDFAIEQIDILLSEALAQQVTNHGE